MEMVVYVGNITYIYIYDSSIYGLGRNDNL